MGLAGPNIPRASMIIAVAAKTITLNVNAAGTDAGRLMKAGWSGGPFISMVNVDRFTLGGGLRLLDVEGGGLRSLNAELKEPSWLGWRALLAVRNFNISGVICDYETKLVKPGDSGKNYIGEDGLHFFGGTRNGNVSDISGTSGDDFICLDVQRQITGVGSADSDIARLNISNVACVSRGAQALRMLVGTGTTVGQIRYINISNYNGVARLPWRQ